MDENSSQNKLPTEWHTANDENLPLAIDIGELSCPGHSDPQCKKSCVWKSVFAHIAIQYICNQSNCQIIPFPN